MKIAIYPGSFDMITLGHYDIIERASQLFDKVYVAIMHNSNKQADFSEMDRKLMIELSISKLKNVEVIIGKGFTVDLAQKLGAQYLVRGLRALTDYEYEYQVMLTNKALYPKIETILFFTKQEYAFLSSTVVKAIAFNGGNLSGFVPAEIKDMVLAKYYKGVNQNSL